MKPRMSKNSSSSSTLKQEFLKKWIKGVQTCSNLNKEMTILDRKNAIKLSADVAIASTRNESTRWSQSVMNDAVSTNRTLVEQILGRKLVSEKNKPAASVTSSTNSCSKRILRRSRRQKATRGVVRKSSSFSIAKKLVKKRTRVLKRLVPAGERISDEYSLIRETLDYILSLRVQVDVMRHFAAAATAAKRFEPSKF
ncbi:hypothetical protein ACP275_10G138100 [Erythranthe tilingii]